MLVATYVGQARGDSPMVFKLLVGVGGDIIVVYVDAAFVHLVLGELVHFLFYYFHPLS